MGQKDNILDLQSGRVNVGLSAIIGVTVSARDSSIIVDVFSGGSLLIGGETLTHANGFLMKGPLSFNQCGTIYFAAVGTTVVVQFLKGLS